MSEMLVHVLIQTAITFEILKTHRGFCIFLSIKVCTLRLCRLEVSARSQVLKSVKMKAISSHRSITINSINQNKSVFILTLVKYFSSLRIQLPLIRSRYYVRIAKSDVCDSRSEIPY